MTEQHTAGTETVTRRRADGTDAKEGSPRRAAHRRPSLVGPTAVSWACVALAVVLRLREYLANPSIWNDEAELGLNILTRSYGGLTHPLASNQGAPLGFLFLEKTAVELFGSGGFAFRLAPFLASLILVFVFRSLAMRTLRDWAGCLAVLLVAVSPTLVSYSTDAKQYSGDAMAVVVLAWVCIRAVERRLDTSSLVVWGVTAAVLVWFSFPAAFAAGAGTVVLVVAAGRDRDRLLTTARATAIWVLSFVVEYLVFLRSLSANSTLVSFWSYGLAPTRGSKTVWLYHAIDGVLHVPLGLIVLPLAFVLLVLGATALIWRRRTIGLFCVVLIAATILGGLVRKYPVADRLVLFLVPVAALLLGATLLVSARYGLLMLPLVVVVAASTFSTAAVALGRPYAMTSGRDALQYAVGHSGPHDLVLIEGSAGNLYSFYHQTSGLTVDGNVYLTTSATEGPDCSPTQATSFLVHYDRVWVVFAPPGTIEPASALDQYRRALEAGGSVQVVKSYPDQTAVLTVDPHTRGDGASSLPVPTWESGTRGCLSFYLFTPARPVKGG
jgi:hypothetical protein